MDYWFDRYVVKRLLATRYVLDGHCVQCGVCCELIGVCAPQYLLRSRLLMGLVVTYYEWVYDFKYSHAIMNEKIILFTCTQFDKVRGRCTCHPNRPAICRSYPLVRYFEPPIVFDSCGFTPRPRCEKPGNSN